MASKPTFYYFPESGPCRTVMMTGRVLGIEFDNKYLDLFKGAHLDPAFVKMNPQHCVPFLVDGDLELGESRVIMTYLVEAYGKDDSLYPKDPKKRAIVNQRLYFDAEKLYTPILDCYKTLYFGSKTFDETQLPKIEDAIRIINGILEKSKYVAGDHLTVADIAFMSSIATAVAVLDYSLKPFQHVEKWFNLMKSVLPDYDEIIVKNGQKLKALVEQCKNKNNP